MLKEAHHWQAGFASPAYSLLVFASEEEAPSFLLLPPCLPLAAMPPCQGGLLPSGTIRQNNKLPHLSAFITATEK